MTAKKSNRRKSATKSIYDIVNNSILTILVFSFALSMALSSLWLFWTSAEQEAATDLLLRQKIASFMHDIVTAHSLNPEGLEHQLKMILQDFNLDCYELRSTSGKTLGKPCLNVNAARTIKLESAGIDVGMLYYHIDVIISVETYIFIVTNFLIFFMATTAIWLVLLRNIRNNILTPLNEIAYSIETNDLNSVQSQEVAEIETLRKRIADYTSQLRNHVKYQAIAKTTQMLAHDVRKPFTMLKSLLDSLNNTSAEDSNLIIREYTPEVERAIKDVNDLISDIIDIDSRSKPSIKAIEAQKLVKKSLGDCFSYLSHTDISINYEWGHRSKCAADPAKINRVVTNIVTNAIQAINNKGIIWIKTRQSGDQTIEFIVGNPGKVIPPEVRSKIFDAFYTEGKINGTGLGLAIAKKLVEEHSGKIWCESGTVGELSYTEFHFTLPAADETTNAQDEILPQHSAGFYKQVVPPPPTLNSRSKVAQSTESEKQKIKIVLCDDELIYRNSFLRQIEGHRDLCQAVQLHLCQDSKDALHAAKHEKPDIFILDVDLNESNANGFILAKEIRALCPNAFIIMHSNRSSQNHRAISQQHGADVFLPKPMPINLITNIIKLHELRKKGEKAFVVVDDSALTLHEWNVALKSKKPLLFQCPEDFWLLASTPKDLAMIDAIITDHVFADLSDTDSIDFSKDLRARGFHGKIYIASNADINKDLLKGLSAKIISKSARAFMQEQQA